MSVLVADETTHRAELELGPPIAAGVVRWLSSTLVTGADPQSDGGCLRKTWFERVGGRDRETTAAMTAGVGMHGEIQEYLDTGRDAALGPIARAGIHLIDSPGPGLAVERPIILAGPGHTIAGYWLEAEGIPWAGHVDLFNLRGHHLDAQGELRDDAPGTLEVKDWKSTSDLVWAKTPEQVARTIQMTSYGQAGLRLWPTMRQDAVRLTHVYFQRRGTPAARLATSLVDRRALDDRWEYARSVVRQVIHAAAEPDADHVDANVRACGAYNRPCPHLAYCEAGRRATTHDSLADLLGPRMAERLLAPVDTSLPGDQPGEDFLMGFLDTVSSPATAPTATAAPSTSSVSIDDLLVEEAALRQEVARPAPVPPTREFTQAVGEINAHFSKLGFPNLAGRAALMFGTLNQHALTEGYAIEGKGKLAKYTFDDPQQVVDLGAEITAKLAAAAPAIALLPPDAPPSDPVKAADPVPGLDTPKARQLAALIASPEIPGLVESVAAPAISPPVQVVAAGGSLAAMIGVGPASAPAAITAQTQAVVAPPTIVNNTTNIVQAPAAAAPAAPKKKAAAKKAGDASIDAPSPLGAIIVLADCSTTCDAQDLGEYVRGLCAQISAKLDPGGVDVRSPKDPNSQIGFGKWRGILCALAAEQPPGAGLWKLDSRGDERAEVVLQGIAGPVAASGGFIARGYR